MAMTPLPDAQVAAIAEDDDIASRYRALALEVLQSRQRRCGSCRWWDVEEDPGGVPVSRVCVKLTDRYGDLVVTDSDWSCADFLPKEQS